MNRFFYRLAKLSPLVPLKTLTAITKQRTIFPFYHAISNTEIIHIKHLYKTRSIKAFEHDLDFITKNYTPTDILTFLEKFRNKETLKQNSFILSFDDGLREFHDIIAPILLRKGIPAVCFLNSAFIDNRDLFFRYKASVLVEKIKSIQSETILKKAEEWLTSKQFPVNDISKTILSVNYLNSSLLDELAEILEVSFSQYLNEAQPYMTSIQIESLIQKGFHFGSHSLNHPQYEQIPLDEQIRQTSESIHHITDRFHLNYKLFSFPFTDSGVSDQFFREVFHPDHPLADLTFGCAGLKNDSWKENIQRIPLEINGFTAHDVIYGEYFYYLFKALFNKNIIARGN
jgi:peptidoglycan/xylan/chitin deacetylase (PgdA/CDA1 family)